MYYILNEKIALRSWWLVPYAYYFKQAENGLYVRMAIISYLLGYR